MGDCLLFEQMFTIVRELSDWVIHKVKLHQTFKGEEWRKCFESFDVVVVKDQFR